MGVSTASVLCSVWVMYINHTEGYRAPQWLRTLTFKHLARILCMKSSVPPVDSINAVGDLGSAEELPERKPKPKESTKADSNSEMASIAKDLRFLCQQLEEKAADGAIADEWRSIARVLDRLLFYIFSFIAFVGIAALLIEASLLG